MKKVVYSSFLFLMLLVVSACGQQCPYGYTSYNGSCMAGGANTYPYTQQYQQYPYQQPYAQPYAQPYNYQQPYQQPYYPGQVH